MSTAAPTLTHATPAIATDTATAGLDSIVTDIAECLTREGARIDARLIVMERGGHLAVASDTGQQGEPFIDLPTQVLVPIDNLTWADESDQVRLVGGSETLTPVQSELLDLHIALWNATDKLATFRAAHPRAAILESAELRDAIALVRPGLTPGDSTRDMLRTRTFSLRAGDSTSSVIMPILELANHHPKGAPYRLRDGRLGAEYHFVDDTGLTYVHYGPHRDAIDLACLYGYATDITTFIVSVPLTVDLHDFGTLVIERSVQRRASATWQVEDGTLRVNYLVLDAYLGLFDALHRPVRDYLITQGASRAQALSLAIDAAEVILNANHVRLTDVIAAAEDVPHLGASTIALAATHQRQVIDVIGQLA